MMNLKKVILSLVIFGAVACQLNAADKRACEFSSPEPRKVSKTEYGTPSGVAQVFSSGLSPAMIGVAIAQSFDKGAVVRACREIMEAIRPGAMTDEACKALDSAIEGLINGINRTFADESIVQPLIAPEYFEEDETIDREGIFRKMLAPLVEARGSISAVGRDGQLVALRSDVGLNDAIANLNKVINMLSFSFVVDEFF